MSLHNKLDTRLATVIKKMLTQPGLTVEQATTEAATHIEQDLLAIIGEDEEDMLASPDGGKYKAWRVTYRNNMRQEIRELIQTYCAGEEYRPVVGYEGIYDVSNLGNVRSLRRRRVLIQRTHSKKDAYNIVTLRLQDKKSTHLVHRLVAKAFIPNPDNKPCVNHIDCHKRNNHVSNLEWVTHSENNEHYYQNFYKKRQQ